MPNGIKNMEKLKLHSPDFTQANIAKLAELFPNCVTEIKDGQKDELGRMKMGVEIHPSAFILHPFKKSLHPCAMPLILTC